MKNILICILLSSVGTFAQNNPSFFKVFPILDGTEPEWVSAMYETDANVMEVIDAYHAYYRVNAFEKNIHTQNFKYWLRTVEPYVQENGEIICPVPELEKERIDQLKAQKYDGIAVKSSAWQNIGPDRTYRNDGSALLRPTQVNVYCMDVAPFDNDILYGAAEGGGIFKSIDHGLNWELISKEESFTNAQDIKVHPDDPNIVYVGSGNDIYKTIDGGLNWSLNYSASGTIEQFYIHRSIPSNVYVAAADGLLFTNDDGATWSELYDARCWDIEAHAINPDILFLSVHNAAEKRAEIYKSTDAGITWELKDTDWYVPTDFAAAADIGCKIGVTPANPNRIYAGLIGNSKSGDNGWIGIYYSEDGAESWVNADGIDGGPYEPGNDPATNWFVAGYEGGYHQGWYNFDIAVSDTDPDKIWIGTIWFCESGNRGANIEYIRGSRSLEMHADIQDIDVVNGEVWVASDGGINFSSDECLSVDVRNTGISASTYWGFNQGWNEDTWTGGRYHNGDAVYHENFGVGNTMFMGGAEQATGYVNPLNNRETHYSDISDKVTPDALSQSSGSTGNFSIYPNESYGLLNSSEVEYDPRYSDHLYLGRDNIFYKSEDGGASFEPLYEFPEFSRVLEFEISRDNPDIIYCIVRDDFNCAIYKSTDQGISFELTSDIPTGSLSRVDITINPSDADELWAAVHFGGDGEKVFATYDGGASWVNKTTGVLDGHAIRDIVFQAGSDHVVYVSSNYNVFYWDEASSEWVMYSEELPFIIRTLHMRPFYRDHKLRLAGGRGVWEASLAEPSLPIAQPMVESDMVYCSRDTVQFNCYSVLNHEGASWLWDFSPMPTYVSSLTERNPKVVFGEAGSYDITLTVVDGEGNSDSKTVENMVTLDDQCQPDPFPGFAMECYETGDYATTNNLDIGPTNEFTISAWVKPNGIQPDYTGIVFNDGTSAGLNFRPDNQLAYHWPGGAWWWDSGLFVEEGVWSHVALVVTPDSITVYLNGVGATHIVSPTPVLIESMRMGSYQGWGSRNYSGAIDEVCIWNRSLTRNELRELRHLTRTGDITYTDGLVAYYQFNLAGTAAINDRIGSNHAVMNAGATKIVSTVPVGEGNSDRFLVESDGTYLFPNSETTFVLAAGSEVNGEVVVSRLFLEPDSLPSDNPNTGNYWIINNYGNGDFPSIESISFVPHDATPDGLAENALLYTRNENEDMEVWLERCPANSLDEAFNYNSDCEITNFHQFFIESAVVDDVIVKIEEVEAKALIKLYPNPNDGLLYIDFEGYPELNIELVDNTGKLITKSKLVGSGRFIDMSKYASGIFFYRIIDNQGEVIQKGKVIRS
ncbi:MAG: LamG-like jellyroll fold domain-containing protein [Crocinitomicaceae bacterium]